ncbi:hypothetical protein [Paenibacillus puerhi]|uniref:hypothetical protein n=1 Tax=Paenibacillus puerhi TaxID=2692622 RepID=UPI00135CA02E|nr:hypothetical protein [Paenibacillus puerhi]
MVDIKQNILKSWFDDYLDLYNFAGTLGDTEWQAQIMHTLRHEQHLAADNVQEAIQRELWREFAALNKKLLDLFAQLQQSRSLYERAKMRETVMDLKKRRLEVSRKIVSYTG